ncbi:hypothetical protein [Brevundimonas naejangsanensis]|uniref:hypothetical protein n=1 Tax=Brevundimonas naejangsanensis TaxID=588932 RepID=UPI001FC880EE|nr:hypothetical protein [Brevundimonas naejangsanensis]
MLDPRDFPAFWGLCGGLLFGAVGLVTAYSAKAGNPLAQRKAWLNLGLGVVAGPILAEAFTPSLIAVVPALDMRGVAMTLGWIAANDPRGFFGFTKRLIYAALHAVLKETQR